MRYDVNRDVVDIKKEIKWVQDMYLAARLNRHILILCNPAVGSS